MPTTVFEESGKRLQGRPGKFGPPGMPKQSSGAFVVSTTQVQLRSQKPMPKGLLGSKHGVPGWFGPLGMPAQSSGPTLVSAIHTQSVFQIPGPKVTPSAVNAQLAPATLGPFGIPVQSK